MVQAQNSRFITEFITESQFFTKILILMIHQLGTFVKITTISFVYRHVTDKNNHPTDENNRLKTTEMQNIGFLLLLHIK